MQRVKSQAGLFKSRNLPLFVATYLKIASNEKYERNLLIAQLQLQRYNMGIILF